ncbi:MAG: aminopeptidase P family N-terminal domain-containing protein, partial [Planctomycetales bacterium]
MSELEINVGHCRGRQGRLLEVMQEKQLDAVILNRTEHVQWLTGPKFWWMFEVAAAISADGQVILVAPERRIPEVHAADELATYDAQWCSTVRNDQREASSRVLLDALAKRGSVSRVGTEFSCCGPHFTARLEAEWVDVEPDLYRLRRRKDPDELARVKKAIAGTESMYRKAREIMRPGINELEIFNELQSAAVREYGEMLTGTGNDYRSGERGGPPRDRAA